MSQCLLSVRGDVNLTTGRPAVIFRLAPLVWITDTEVVVDGGHHANGLNAAGHTYRVRFTDSAWVVVEDRVRWIA